MLADWRLRRTIAIWALLSTSTLISADGIINPSGALEEEKGVEMTNHHPTHQPDTPEASSEAHFVHDLEPESWVYCAGRLYQDCPKCFRESWGHCNEDCALTAEAIPVCVRLPVDCGVRKATSCWSCGGVNATVTLEEDCKGDCDWYVQEAEPSGGVCRPRQTENKHDPSLVVVLVVAGVTLMAMTGIALGYCRKNGDSSPDEAEARQVSRA
mmetsp:Transcript_17484/g.27063  ORF Transcript_17484/g.27063 Transcript_17484/m.27063 type:complete len:212 (+) Transcript_17484:143-778(+)